MPQLSEGVMAYLSGEIGSQSLVSLMSDSKLRADVLAYKGGSCDGTCKARLKKRAEQQWGSSWRSKAQSYAEQLKSSALPVEP